MSLVLACVACVAVAAWVFHWDGFMGPDAGARFAMVRSWAHGGSPLFLGSEHAGGARVLDPLVGYTVAVPRGVCVVYPPLFTILSAISFFALGRAGLVVLPALGGLVAAWYTHRAARAWGIRSSRWAAAIVFFATPLVLYASTFWDHAIHVAIVGAATLLLLRAHAGRVGAAVAAGIVVGGGVWFHELLLAVAVAFAISLAPRRALLWRFCAGLVGPVALWMLFNAMVYGAIRGPHLMGPLEPLSPSNVARFTNLSSLLERAMAQLAGGAGLREALFAAGFVALVVFGAIRARRAAFVMTIALTALAAWSMVTSGYASGLFQVTPWLLFAFADVPRGDGWQDRAHRALVTAALAFIGLVLVTPIAPGLNWGSRYLLTMLPVYALLALRTAQRSASRARLVATAGYALLAAFVFFRGTTTYRAKMVFDRQHARAVMRIHTRFTSTNLWWLGPELEPTDYDTTLHLVAYVPATEQLAAPLPSDPDRSIRDAFFAHVSEAKLGEFSFVGDTHALIVMRMAGAERGWELTDVYRDADFAIARFTRASRRVTTAAK